MRMLVLGASLLALAACGGDSAAPKPEAQAKPAKLPAGEWEVTSTVQSLRSADNSTPAIDLKEGQATTARVCVADGALPAKLFTGNDDPCTTDTAYNRNGRLNIAFQCRREGKGSYSATVDGQYQADSFEAALGTATVFSGTGDYQMNQRLTAKRLGDCPAAPAAPAAG